MDPIFLFKQTNFSKSIWWKINHNIRGYKNETGFELVTEIFQNRCFRILESNLREKDLRNKSRILVQFFEDGYICWINIFSLNIEEYDPNKQKSYVCDEDYIQDKMRDILYWIEKQSEQKNEYLWGGTIGPNYDCSGLIQTAFFKHNIYIPRDSFQIKNFSRHLFNFPGNIDLLEKGDLLFFGDSHRCNHIGIYYKKGEYFHSSGKHKGRNGIAKDNLIESEIYDSISLHYKSQLISAGRIYRSYRWDKTLR